MKPKVVTSSRINVLDFLIGFPYDQIAINYLTALRPSVVLVCHEKLPEKYVPWRVCVKVDENNIITGITQEVEVGVDGFNSFSDLNFEMTRRGMIGKREENLMAITMASKKYDCSLELLKDSVRQAPQTGLLLEFGVASGKTINVIAESTSRPVYGFDSFMGLPEDWGANNRKGTFSTNGTMPQVNSNVKLIPGWFKDTVRSFLEQKNQPVAFVHIDCDLYSSTKTVLDAIEPYLMNGAIINFNEFMNYPQAHEHELKAFIEFMDMGWNAHCIGKCGNRYTQAAFRMTKKLAEDKQVSGRRCGNCKHWGEEGDSGTFRTCMATVEDKHGFYEEDRYNEIMDEREWLSDSSRHEFILNKDSAKVVVTSRMPLKMRSDFSCNMWENK